MMKSTTLISQMRRRFLLALLCLSLMLPTWLCAASVTSATALPPEKAASEALLSDADFEALILPAVRARVGVPAEYTEFVHNSYAYDEHEAPRRSLTWSLPQTNSYDSSSGMVAVVCDDVGRILSYENASYAWNFNWTDDIAPQMTRRNPDAKVEEIFTLITRLCPDIADQLAATPLPRYQLHANRSLYDDLFFPRVIDGVPCLNNGVTVSYDYAQQQVRWMTRVWDDLAVFDPTEPQLDPIVLQDIVSARSALTPAYALFLNYPEALLLNSSALFYQDAPYSPAEPRLVYYPAKAGEELTLSAADGSPRSTRLNPYDPSPVYSSPPISSKLGNFNAPIYENPDKVPGHLSAEELAAKVQNMPELFFPAGTILRTDGPYYHDIGGRAAIVLHWNGPEVQGPWGPISPYSIEATLDIVSGELLRYTYYSSSNGPAVANTDSAALQVKAEAFFQTYHPDKFAASHSTAFAPHPYYYPGESDSAYSVTPWLLRRVRLAQGIEYLNNYADLQIDAKSGKIVSFELLWQENVTFPQPTGKVTIAEADELLLRNAPVQLFYQIDEEHQGKLLYHSEILPWLVVDAQEGYLMFNDGRRFHEADLPLFPELKGHPQEELIEECFASGWLYLKNGRLEPDRKVTQEEFVEMLSIFFPLYRSTSDYGYEHFISLGHLEREEVKPEETISQGRALKLILDLAGYGAVANLPDVFTPVSGVAKELQGYAAIAVSLGLIGDDFSAQQPLTQLQAALLIAQFLNRYNP